MASAVRTEHSPYGIVTPEAVVLDLAVAGVASRLFARLIDLLVLVVGAMVLFTVAGFVLVVVPQAGLVATIVVSASLMLGYPVISETVWNGRTVGKYAVGLRVITVDGAPVRFRHALLRGLLGIVEVFLTMGAVAALTALCTRRNQRFGDLAAGTVVVRGRDPSQRTVAVAFPPPPGWEAYVRTLDVSSITPRQYGALRSYLTRVFELTPDARVALAARLADPLAHQIRHSPPPMMAPELFLACVAAAYQLRHGGPLSVPGWWIAPAAPHPGGLSPPSW